MARDVTLRPFAHERLVLALIALAAFAPVHRASAQDTTRLALSQALIEDGGVAIDKWAPLTDQATYRGHTYSDKAPGISFLAIPGLAVVRLEERAFGGRTEAVWEATKKLWLIRVLTVAPFLLVLAWLLGRVAEGLVPGAGVVTAVGGGLGTMLAPLSTVLFAHVVSACLTFGAFVVVWRWRSRWTAVAAGTLASSAVLVEYEAAIVVLGLGLYVLAARGARSAGAYLAGGIPAALALAAYNLAAFGSPFHLSYRYVDNPFAESQSSGFFGIHVLRLDGLREVLVGDRGLVLVSPVLVAAAGGLVLMTRTVQRREAVLATAVTAAFVLVNAGYFLPYGGDSPGPRFTTIALPFLLVGLPIAIATWPRLASGLVILSVGLMTGDALTWSPDIEGRRFHALPETIWSTGPIPRLVGVVLVCSTAVAALSVAFVSRDRRGR